MTGGDDRAEGTIVAPDQGAHDDDQLIATGKVEGQDALEQALTALHDAETELDTLRQSTGVRLGSLMVEAAKSAKQPFQFIKNLGPLALTISEFVSCARIDTGLFVGLPTQARSRASLTDRKDARRAAQLARAIMTFGKRSSAVSEFSGIEAGTSAPWLKTRAHLALELAGLVRTGFPLPARSVAQPCQQNGCVFYLVQSDPVSLNNGYTHRTHQLATRVAALGWDIQPIVAPAKRRAALDVPFGGLVYRRLMMQSRYEDGVAGYVADYADQIVKLAEQRRPAVIHAASNFLNGLAGATAARRLGIPCIYEVRGLWELTWLVDRPEFADALGFHAQVRLETDAAAASDRVLPISSEIAGELAKRGIAPRTMLIAPSGAPPQYHATYEERRAMRQLFGIADDAFVTGYIGSIVSYEGLATLIRSFVEVKAANANARLLLVGQGTDRQALMALANRLGLANDVIFPGRLNPSDARRAYAALDVACYPRDDTRVTQIVPPLKHMEAASAGLAIIVSSVAPLKSFADRTGAALVVPSGDAAALARALIDLMHHPERREELGKAARAAAARETWGETARIVCETYRDVTSAH